MSSTSKPTVAPKHFICINLRHTANGVSRWSLYSLENGALEVVWGQRVEKNDRFDFPKHVYEANLPYQVTSMNKNLPAFHFCIKGYGINHQLELAEGLSRHYGCPVELVQLQGHQPSYTKAGF